MALIKQLKPTTYRHHLIAQTMMVVLFFFTLFLQPGLAQKRTHSIYFESTDYELSVYRIYGKKPGKTLLLIGGIQGDEPGGFLSADQYADIHLAKGNLIVVPRANFQSIVLMRRQINEDMNRKFAEDHQSNYETKIVSILKKLICEADYLLNLHDGSGFYSRTWKGPNRNPKRFGQSIIADTDVYKHPETGGVIDLGQIAEDVCREINKEITNRDHHFHFNNHNTKKELSTHKEQRKSATYYALYTCRIPAFGIETSKAISLEEKVHHHNLAINAFMRRFGIVPQTPGINLDRPSLSYLVLSINDSLPVVIKNQQTLYVQAGDRINISHIESNFERGLTADIVGYGTINDLRKDITITGSTRIVVRKDYYPCGSVYLALSENQNNIAKGISVKDGPGLSPTFLAFKIRINNIERVCQNEDRVQVTKGDIIEIVDIMTGMADPSEMIVNCKGFVGNPSNNTGEDRGYRINTGKDLWKRYSINKQGKAYQVVVTYKKKVVGKLFIELNDPKDGNRPSELSRTELTTSDDITLLSGDSK